MSDEKKANIAAWGGQIAASDAPVEGVDRQTLRKALQLNPEMKKLAGGTQGVMDMLAKAKGTAAPAEGEARKTTSSGMTVVQVVEHLKQKFYDEQKRLQDEIGTLQQAMKALAPQMVDRLVDNLVQNDPNISSPLTQEVLKTEGKFLADIGFKVSRVVDAQKKKR